MTEVLRLTGVDAGFEPGRPILHEWTLSVAKGTLLAVVGPNGSGKSTLLHLLGGRLRCSRGQVSVLGEDPTRWSARLRAQRIAHVAQREDFRVRLSVREFVELGRFPWQGFRSFGTDEDDRVITGVLEDLDLWALRDHLVSEISGGEQQRAAIARALAQTPQVILLDEPTASFDPALALDLWRRLLALSRTGVTLVVVSHDLVLPSGFADQVAIVRAGRLVEMGPPREVFRPELLSNVYGVPFRSEATGGPVAAVVVDVERARRDGRDERPPSR